MSGFVEFTTVAPVKAATVDWFANSVPAPIIDLWRSQGTGYVGDGFLRVIDPARGRMMLDGVVGLPEGSVPVFTTALADLVVWIPPLFHTLRFRYGVIDVLGADAATLIANLNQVAYQDQVFTRSPYPEGAARLGVPGLDECFAFVPLLALGGQPHAANLDRCGMWEHFSVVTQLAGPLRSR
jgi:hypothetical protein